MGDPVRDSATEPVRDTAGLWAAVDAITKASSRRIDRDEQPAIFNDPDVIVCRIGDYKAAVVSHGVIPSLWEQAELALQTGREQMEGHGSPLAQRSPADLDLMELLLTIRESMAWQLPGRGIVPKAGIPEQMRQLASHIISAEPQHVAWWTYRFAQWSRMLAVYLHAIDTGPKPLRLRNAACPLCKTRQVILDTDQGPVVAPPILIDFENGWIRAATCTACTATWWRGNELGELAEALDKEQARRITA